MVRRNLRRIALSAALLLGGCAQSVVVSPSWSSMPDGDALAEAYPEFASMIGVGGWAQLRCRSDRSGALAACRVIKTVPDGLGFDRAALAMTPRFTLNPLQVDGAVEKSTVEFTVRFTAPPEEEAIPPWTGPEPSEESLSLARVVASRMSALMGDPASEILAELDVDADRVEPVTRMVERVSAAFEGRRIESAALMLARTGDTAQLEALAEGRLPPGSIPSEQAVQAASPEMAAAYRDFERQLREVYCARYACASAER